MIINQTNQLTLEQIKAVSDLEKAAFHKYGLENHAFLSNEINFDRTLPCFFMGYVGDRLVAFLSAFIPTPQEAEISAVTHPDFQRKGCFTALFQAAKQVILGAGIHRVLFVMEPKSKNGLAALKSFQKISFDRSEYRMWADQLQRTPAHGELHFFEVDHTNRELFGEVLRQVHPEMDDRENYVEAVINSKQRKGYIAYREMPIGVFNLNYEDGCAFLYGVGVVERYRGMGLGLQMVGYAMEQGLKNAPKMILDVDSSNPIAFHIYQKSGFQIEFQVDYYSYNLA